MFGALTPVSEVFEIETAALAHVAWAPQESGVLLTDFAAAYPSVKHSWILSVVEKTDLPEFIRRFLRDIYRDKNTHIEFAGTSRGQIQMARGVRQGCPANGLLVAMKFDPIFTWHEAVTPRNPHNLDFLQPSQSAYADDLIGSSISICGSHCWPQFGLSEMLLGSEYKADLVDTLFRTVSHLTIRSSHIRHNTTRHFH